MQALRARRPCAAVRFARASKCARAARCAIWLVLSLAIATGPRRVLAQPGLTPAGETPASAPATEPTAAVADPHIDRAVLLPTTETQPRGKWIVTNYDLFLLAASYGLTDRAQFSLMSWAPYPEAPLFLTGSLKWRVIEEERFHAALLGAATVIGDSPSDSDLSQYYTGMMLASLCVDADCHSLASAALGVMAIHEGGDPDQVLLTGVSLIQRLHPHIKLLLEVGTLHVSALTDDGEASLTTLDYGFRFGNPSLSIDLTFVRPVTSDEALDDPHPGYPVVAVSYRPGM